MLVGRADEQRTIDALVQRARDGFSAVLVIRGEPGIGKSALLEHAESAAEGMRLLRCIGVESEHELPFAGMHQLVRPSLDLIDRPSADALVFVARRLHAEPIALVMAAREGDPRRFDAPGLDDLHLDGIGAEPARELITARLSGRADERVVMRLLGEARGNPLALLELPAGLKPVVRGTACAARPSPRSTPGAPTPRLRWPSAPGRSSPTRSTRRS